MLKRFINWIKYPSRFSLITTCVVLLTMVFFLGKVAYDSTQQNNMLMSNITDLQGTISVKPKIIKIDSIIYNDRIFNVFKVPNISQNDNTSKIAAIGKGKADSLNKALNITTKDLLSYREINASLLLENKMLRQSKNNADKFEYKDSYVNLVIDRNTFNIDTLSHKINIQSASYMKSPKWYKAKQENYMLSVDDKRVVFNVIGFDPTPKVTKSMLYVDTRYQMNPKSLSNGNISSTLNYEFGMDNIISSYVGGGYLYNFTDKPQPVINLGIKANIFKIKK